MLYRSRKNTFRSTGLLTVHGVGHLVVLFVFLALLAGRRRVRSRGGSGASVGALGGH